MAASREIEESHMDHGGTRKFLLLLVASNRRRGAEVFGEKLADGLTARGWQVDFVALQSVDSERRVSATPLVDSHSLGRFDLPVIRNLRKRINDTKPSVVLANGGATLRYGSLATTALRRRPVLAYTSIGEPRYWLRSPNHARLQRFLHARPDVVFAVSEATRKQLVADLRVEPGRVYVAPTGVASDYFVEQAPPHRGVRLLFMGNLSHEKGPLKALDAVRGIDNRLDATLRFVGDGPLADDLRQKSKDAGLDNRVEFEGSVEDVRSHLRWADILVLPSETEGLPGAVLEAAAAGVPSVAFDVGGTSETMISDETGLLVTPGATQSMVDAIEGLARDPGRLETMGVAAKEFVARKYTLDQSIDRYDKVLTAALAESRTR